MSAAALLAELTHRGIDLEASGDTLRYRPRSAVTPELADRIKATKGELLALLRVDRGCRSDCDRLVGEMWVRVNREMPAGCNLSEMDWKRLDAIHQQILGRPTPR